MSYFRDCVCCGCSTQFKKAEPGREASGLCKECFDVEARILDPTLGALLTCMRCDRKCVLSERELNCKPCRIEDPEKPRSGEGWYADRGAQPDDFDPDPSFENGIRQLEG